MYSSKLSLGCFWVRFDVMVEGCGVNAVLTMGAPVVPQLVGATWGVQLAPPVSFFSLIGSLKEIKHRITETDARHHAIFVIFLFMFRW